ncbi:lipoprotein [Streptomyces sp. Je 1-79]|uniref:lipoprotein n=1 Tax=Streptomyces sp. Je 1-79 TaxID=2943847 RepID=UPI0021A347DF|nr:lipoprotein [Streptomyces sp. Je 1-79]MCT4355521.1 lipoprotein [Streptomyces sp. Je 1-79]
MRHPIRVLVPALAVLTAAGALTGCGATAKPDPDAAPVKKPTAGASTAAAGAGEAAGSVGGSGTACELPVSFGLAADWKPKAVKATDDEVFAALGKQGPATMTCEIDAKPAGNIGYLRVWAAGEGAARTALEGFVKAEKNATEVSYRETEAGALPAVEVTYTVYNKLMEESKEERAFAVAAPKGTVIVHLGGLDTEEHREMLPAYELARSSLKAL